MPPRRKTKADVASALSTKAQPEISQGSVAIKPSFTTTRAPASNGQGSIATGSQTLPDCLQNSEPKPALPNKSKNAPKPRPRRKPKTNKTSTPPSNPQPDQSRKPSSPRSPLVSSHQGETGMTMASVPLSGASRAVRSRHRIPGMTADLVRQREKGKINVASSSLGNTPLKTRQFSSAITQASALPITPAPEGLALATVAQTFLSSPKALEPNKSSPNLSQSPNKQ